MKITPIKTKKIISNKESLFSVLDKYITCLHEKSIVAITSKIVSLCEGRVVKIGNIAKKTLINQEADFILPYAKSKYNIILTIKNNLLIPTAGIDESNGNGNYVLWPLNPQKTANQVRIYLSKRFSLKKIGVIFTDSRTNPMQRGTIGVAIAYSGFSALNNYIGKPDVFGRILKMTKSNVLHSLATSAVLIMGEGNEQTPLAIIEDVPFVEFQERNPTKQELKELKINLNEDLYAPLLKSVRWRKGQ